MRASIREPATGCEGTDGYVHKLTRIEFLIGRTLITSEAGGHWDGPEVLSADGTSASAVVILTAECPVVAHRHHIVRHIAARHASRSKKS